MTPWQSQRQKQTLPFILYIPLALLIWLAVMREFRLDDAFITYRYARNVAAGLGLVYNPGALTLSTTAPLYALLLAALSLIVPDFHLLGGLIGAVSIGLGGGLIVLLLPDKVAYSIRLLAGLLYTLAIPLWLALGMETPLWILLVLAAVWLTGQDRWTLAGLLIGLAMLTRPDAALPGLLLGLYMLVTTINRWQTRAQPWRPLLGYALAAALPVLVFYGWAWLTYGSPLPATLSAKRAQAEMGITGFGVGTTTWEGLRLIGASLLAQSPLYLLMGGLAIVGLFVLGAANSATLIIVLWGGLHVAVYAVLHVAPYRWYYAPLVPGVVMLAALGLDFLAERLPGLRLRQLVVGILALLLLLPPLASFITVNRYFAAGGPPGAMVPVVDWATYQETGAWLAANTPPDALIGVAEVGQLGFYAERNMTDNPGLLQPVVAGNLKRGDAYSWLPAFAPDIVTFQRFGDAPPVIFNVRLDTDPWFTASYALVETFDDPRYAYGPVEIYERVTVQRPMTEYRAAFDFGPLRLTGWATDAVDLSEGQPGTQPVRVRLDWQVSDPDQMPERINLAVSVLDAGQTPNFDRVYDAENWTGDFATWHTLVLDENLPPGGYALVIAAGPDDGANYAAQAVGWLDVSFPKTALVDGVPAFGDGAKILIQLADSAVATTTDPITIDLTWQAAADIATVDILDSDYTLFVHLRPVGEIQPLAQADGMPLAGHYPTHLWQAGEVVPDTVTLPLPDETGVYEVVVGWYVAPNGPRLILPDGTDTLTLTEIIIE
ncbi:hypothetical protein ACFLYO_07405 [Chloroflexota bacterium]